MINAYPIAFSIPIPGGAAAYLVEPARLEIALSSPTAGEGRKLGKVELTIWSKSGQYKIEMAAPAALPASQDVMRILAAQFPEHFTLTSDVPLPPIETPDAA